MDAEKDASFERSQTDLIQDKTSLKCEIKANDYSVFKSRVHGTLKSLALIQRLQSLPKKIIKKETQKIKLI